MLLSNKELRDLNGILDSLNFNCVYELLAMTLYLDKINTNNSNSSKGENFNSKWSAKVRGCFTQHYVTNRLNESSYNSLARELKNKDILNEELPEINLLTVFNNNKVYREYRYNSWFSTISDKAFHELNKYCSKKTPGKTFVIELINSFYNVINSSPYAGEQKKILSHLLLCCARELFKYPEEINFKQNEKSIFYITDIYCESSDKKNNSVALKLIQECIKNELSKDEILRCFKLFLNNNKQINPSSEKYLDFIKNAIKDWDLSNHFTVAEQKLLYGKQDGFVSKRVEGLVYDIDVNFVARKTKAIPSDIFNNMKILLNTIPPVLGNDDKFLSITQNMSSPLINFTVSFEVGVEENKVEALNTIIQTVLTEKNALSQDYIKKLVDSLLLKLILEAKLNKTENKVLRRKI